jgi:rRNA small subunit pseudouridine methyltransferase Nep1
MSDEAKDRWDGPMLHLMLIDSELEIVPRDLWSHPAVVSNARKRGKRPSQVLLDSNLHHSALGGKEEAMRRGRPDIVHQFLLIGLDSLLNLEGGLKLYVHTRNDELILTDPTTRLPKNLNRYMGLFEELFASGAVPSKENPLLSLKRGSDLKGSVGLVRELTRKKGRDLKVVLLSPVGDRKDPLDLFESLSIDKSRSTDILCLIGGFSHGDFMSDAGGLSDITVSISGELLKVWSVEMELIVKYRMAFARGSK